MEKDEELFAGAERRAVTFSLLEETYQEFMTLCQANGWSEEEGLPTVFANGIAYLKNERDFSLWNGQDRDAEMLRLARYGNDMYAGYSIMKFRAFTYHQDMQTLEFNVTGLRGLLALSEATVERLRAENERLKADLAAKT
ncbi:MAG: hypothetical protein M1482_02905 [Chloroflexi bacterium]|nr:hypothetical protein [Chloroflexota bacterium]